MARIVRRRRTARSRMIVPPDGCARNSMAFVLESDVAATLRNESRVLSINSLT